jgi:8-oxo-dGTP pyrophosphatase MutT (NUDIX family)
MMRRKLRFYALWPGLYLYFRFNQHRARVIVRCGNEILVIQDNGRFGADDTSWTLPGGGIGRHEDDAEAAARELHEELGITVQPKTLVYLGERTIGSSGLVYLAQYFLVDIIRKPVLEISPHEVRGAAWYSLTEAAGLPQKWELTVGLELLSAKR